MIRYCNYHSIFILTCFFFTSCSIGYGSARQAETISPLDYGLAKAKTGEERFRILFETHSRAVAYGLRVSYEGINTIDLVIPKDAQSIPLTTDSDFSNVVFNVRNDHVDLYLFNLVHYPQTIIVSKTQIDNGDFHENTILSKGRHLLTISDQIPWVENRSGYKYGHTRKDILLVKDGIAVNKPVMPYNNDNSQPSCQVYSLPEEKAKFENITLNRVIGSSRKTYLCSIVGFDNLTLSNVKIYTPTSVLTNDIAISIVDCTNVTFKDILIDGTYSRKDYSGYGVSMNNIWNFTAERMIGRGNWGVFGNNNINKAFLDDCELNRFDIHCYGRDVEFRNTTFFDCYNQFSSVYGDISFYNCTFQHFTPVLYEASYNAYVGHDISFANCTFYLSKSKNCLISAGRLSRSANTRKELSFKSWPNISIKKMKVIVQDDVKEMNVFSVTKDIGYSSNVDYISRILIKGLVFNYVTSRKPVSLNVSNEEINTNNALSIQIEDVNLSSSDNYSDGIMQIRFNKGSNKNTISIKRSHISNLATLKQ